MNVPDPLHETENVLHQAYSGTRKKLNPYYRRYPTLFILLVTFSVAAVFHGFDLLMDQVELLNTYPLITVLIGIVGLFVTGKLYKRLGEGKHES